MRYYSRRFFIARCGLLLQSLCASACAGVLRYAVWSGGVLPFAPIEVNVLTMFISASIFVLSILLAGVLSDYKDAERIPADLSSTFDAILSQILALARVKKSSPRGSLNAMCAWLIAVARVVDDPNANADASTALHAAETALLAETISTGAWNTALAGWVNAVGARVSRLRVIQATSFYLPAYTLYDSLFVVVLGLLVLTRHGNDVMAMLVTCVFSFLFFYLASFVRAIDNPFVFPKFLHERKVRRAFGGCERLGKFLELEEMEVACPGGGDASKSAALLAVRGPTEAALPEAKEEAHLDALVNHAGMNSIDFDILFEDFALRLAAEARKVA
jgi:hypothetical protein